VRIVLFVQIEQVSILRRSFVILTLIAQDRVDVGIRPASPGSNVPNRTSKSPLDHTLPTHPHTLVRLVSFFGNLHLLYLEP